MNDSVMIKIDDNICIITENRAIYYICAIGIVFPRWVSSRAPRLSWDD